MALVFALGFVPTLYGTDSVSLSIRTRACQIPLHLTDPEPPEDDDTTVADHVILRQRYRLPYVWLIEHEVPKLAGGSTESAP